MANINTGLGATEVGTLTVMDPDGDLILHVGSPEPEPKQGLRMAIFQHSKPNPVMEKFKVCSATLRRSSPVWKAMLTGPWIEAQPATGDWVVQLSNDSPKDMRVLLAIVHGRFRLVPDDLSIEDTADILQLADKHDMMSLLRPWHWIFVRSLQSLQDHISERERCEIDHVAAVRAAWFLGLEDILSQQLWALVLITVPDWINGLASRCKFPATVTSKLRESGLEDLEDIILELRDTLVYRISWFYKDEMYRRKSDVCQVGDIGEHEKKLCNQVVVGGVFLNHVRTEIPPFPEGAEEEGERMGDYNAADLLYQLREVFSKITPLSNVHRNCVIDQKLAAFEEELKSQIVQDVLERETILSPAHTQRLAEQRQKFN
ncbi:hypothetical protein VTJ49DRAFT_5495 [Mycothermus thermophilus]|uniref:BTB domain-containing protein n=1 Tax=Humicola insolens TaxID=85995 RepID=A0ABR3VL62_HUMIN